MSDRIPANAHTFRAYPIPDPSHFLSSTHQPPDSAPHGPDGDATLAETPGCVLSELRAIRPALSGGSAISNVYTKREAAEALMEFIRDNTLQGSSELDVDELVNSWK